MDVTRREASTTEELAICFTLSLFRFADIYDACQYSWRVFKSKEEEWFSRMDPTSRKLLGWVHAMVTHKLFNSAVYLVVLVNGIILVIDTSLISYEDSSNENINTETFAYFSYFFIGREYSVRASQICQCLDNAGDIFAGFPGN